MNLPQSEKLNNFIKPLLLRLVCVLKEKPGVILLSLLIICVASAGAVYYFYVTRVPTSEPTGENIKIDSALYQRVLERLDAREKNIQESANKEYQNIFR